MTKNSQRSKVNNLELILTDTYETSSAYPKGTKVAFVKGCFTVIPSYSALYYERNNKHNYVGNLSLIEFHIVFPLLETDEYIVQFFCAELGGRIGTIEFDGVEHTIDYENKDKFFKNKGKQLSKENIESWADYLCCEIKNKLVVKHRNKFSLKKI